MLHLQNKEKKNRKQSLKEAEFSHLENLSTRALEAPPINTRPSSFKVVHEASAALICLVEPSVPPARGKKYNGFGKYPF